MIGVSSSLDPDQDRHSVGPNLDSKRFAKRVPSKGDTNPSNLGLSDPAVLTNLDVAANLDHAFTIHFAINLFSRIALKDIFVTLKIRNYGMI